MSLRKKIDIVYPRKMATLSNSNIRFLIKTLLFFSLLGTNQVYSQMSCEIALGRSHSPFTSIFSSFLKEATGWLIKKDELGRSWVLGSTLISRGVRGLYLHAPQRLKENDHIALLMDYFASGHPHILPEGKVGTLFQMASNDGVHNYQMIHGKRIRESDEILSAHENLVKDQIDFILDGYSREMNIDSATLETLRKISLRLRNRTIWFSKVSNSQFEVKHDREEILYRQDQRSLSGDPIQEARNAGRIIKDHFDFEIAASLVTSKSSREKLPLELLTGYKVNRPRGKTVVEIGRMFSQSQHPEFTLYLIATLAGYIKGMPNVGKVVIEADVARARLFKRYGFSPVHKRKNFAGETEFIMEVDPVTLYNKTLSLVHKGATITDALRFSHENTLIFDYVDRLDPTQDSPIVTSTKVPLSEGLHQLVDLFESSLSPKEKRNYAKVIIRNDTNLELGLEGRIEKFIIDMIYRKTPSAFEAMKEWTKNHLEANQRRFLFTENPVEVFFRENVDSVRQSQLPKSIKEAEILELMRHQFDLILRFSDNELIELSKILSERKNDNESAYSIAVEFYKELILKEGESH